jgi:hypothetical protein
MSLAAGPGLVRLAIAGIAGKAPRFAQALLNWKIHENLSFEVLP